MRNPEFAFVVSYRVTGRVMCIALTRCASVEEADAVRALGSPRRVFPAGINSRTEPHGLFSGLSASLVERSGRDA